ncbi:MAG TPA: M20/M25/M40 family metallo-hydrolase [Vicinamibacterales bacterium]|nr:M20/M25/M40 family metallo-hydrolase [Vicinamibacterales bacterium]
MTRFITATLAIAAAATLAAQPPTILKVREWRTTHEKAILHELYDLVAIPNVATDAANIRRNAEALTRMFEKRRFAPEILPTAGTSPLVVAERRQPNVRRTITFYFHYDGQPVTASEWIYEPPFKPVIVAEHADSEQGRTITLDTWQDAIDPQWRIYGRSTSDDKSPIVAFLSAVEALDAANVPLTSNVRVVMEGEEEAGSPNLAAAVQKYADRIRGDALLLVDGPRHPSDRPTLNFGARGIMNAVVTVYGAAHDLHSGNYGNWAPNPALQLARLLASMKDDRGRVTIDGFYDDVTPLTAEETQAIADIPDEAPMLMKAFGFARPESPDRLELRHNLPTLNIDAFESGGGTGGQGRTIIPASATARLDLRFVKHIDPTTQFDRLVAHVKKQGYVLVDHEPDAATRAAHPLLATVTRVGGYPAGRTPLDIPIARAITKAVSDASDGKIVRLPTIGGSAPFYLFSDVLKVPTVGLSIVNFDNNQHGANENVKIKNIWDGIETMAAILTMP